MVVSTSKEYNVNNFELDRLSTRNYDFELDRLNTSNEDLQEMETKYDYVLVSKDIDNEELREDRDRYEENLRHRGLDLEFVRPISDDLKNICFVLVHAPLDPVLFQKAEDMHIQMPLKDEANREPATSNSEPQSILTRFYRKLVKKRLDPFTIKEPNVCIRNWNTVTSFSKSNVKAFQKKDDNGFFENAERSRMVKRILQLTSFTVKESKEVIEHFDDDTSRYKGHGIEQLCHIGVYDSYYPMHDGPSIIHNNHVDNDRQRLRADWASFSMSLKYQPLDAIRDYFGVRVGFYFAWLGLYTSFLVPAAVVGLLCFIYGLCTMNTAQPLKEICDKKNERLFYMCPQCDRHCSYYSLTSNCHYSKLAHLFDNEATIFFSVFMSIWATLFLECWKRTEANLAFRWNVYDLLKEYEPLRPDFVSKVETKKKNPVTDKDEPYLPLGIIIRRHLGALAVVFFMVLVVVSTLVGIVVYRASVLAALYANSSNDIREYAGALTSFTAACINLVIIQILTFFYQKIAVYLTNWENPRTMADYHNSFTLKMYVFQFVNTYSSLFYVAFFQTNLINGNPSKYNRVNERRIEECNAAGCLIDVCIQLFVIMIGKQILGLIYEFVFPVLKKRWRDRSRSLYKNKKIPQWEDDYWLEEEPEFRIFYEYLDMVIQFGFVTMFVASFPLAPLFALINNFVEIRADAINFVVNYRRRVSEQVKNIGIWFKILEMLTTISVVVNSFVIAFTTDFIPRFVYVHYYSESGSLEGYVNNSLSYIKISDLEKGSHPEDPYKNLNYTLPYCRFKEYLEPNKPYNFSKQYFTVMMGRFIFIVVFQYFIFVVRYIIRRLVPKISSSLQARIARKIHVARLCFRKSAVQATQEINEQESERRGNSKSTFTEHSDGQFIRRTNSSKFKRSCYV